MRKVPQTQNVHGPRLGYYATVAYAILMIITITVMILLIIVHTFDLQICDLEQSSNHLILFPAMFIQYVHGKMSDWTSIRTIGRPFVKCKYIVHFFAVNTDGSSDCIGAIQWRWDVEEEVDIGQRKGRLVEAILQKYPINC